MSKSSKFWSRQLVLVIIKPLHKFLHITLYSQSWRHGIPTTTNKHWYSAIMPRFFSHNAHSPSRDAGILRLFFQHSLITLIHQSRDAGILRLFFLFPTLAHFKNIYYLCIKFQKNAIIAKILNLQYYDNST